MKSNFSIAALVVLAATLMGAQAALAEGGDLEHLECGERSRGITEVTYVPGFEPRTQVSALEAAEAVVDSELIEGDSYSTDEEVVSGGEVTVVAVTNGSSETTGLIEMEETAGGSYLPTVVEVCE